MRRCRFAHLGTKMFLGADWFVDVAEILVLCRCRAPITRRAAMQPRRVQPAASRDGIDGGDALSWDDE
jgi:hypothetical protein